MDYKVKQFAKKEGFDNVAFIGQWNTYTIYEAYFEQKEGDIDPPLIGYPQYILEKDGLMRFSGFEETFSILDELFEDEED